MAPHQNKVKNFNSSGGNRQNTRGGGVRKNFNSNQTPGRSTGSNKFRRNEDDPNHQELGQRKFETAEEVPPVKKRAKKMEIRGGQLLPIEDASDDEEVEQTFKESEEESDDSDDEPAPSQAKQSKPAAKPQNRVDKPNLDTKSADKKNSRKKDGLTDFQRAKQTYNRIQQEREEAAERRRLNEERRDQERQIALDARKRRGKALKLRTKKGQPNLNVMMECIVEKLERKRDRDNRNQGR